ncbi:MAG: hypothetical protein FWC97_02510 [Treponema sp.]|nr:hypothetical protein [Treponema sp.]
MTKTLIYLVLFFVFISPLFAESDSDQNAHYPEYLDISIVSSDDEDFLPADEIYITEEAPVTEETPAAEEIYIDEEFPENGEHFVTEEHIYVDEYEGYLFFEAPELVIEVAPEIELRSFDDIFPYFTRSERRMAMDEWGLRNAIERGESPMINPDSNSGIDLLSRVRAKNPSHIIEALIVIPHSAYSEREFDVLDIYNALGRISKIQDQTFRLRSGGTAHIFAETTRVESAQNRRPISDPSPSDTLPFSETMFLRFTDRHIGSIYLRGDLSFGMHGLNYSLTNFRDINFSIFRVMRAERVSINLYLEPIKEGVLVYSVTGLALPGFLVNRMNLTPNINVRIYSLKNWIAEGLREQETLAARQETENVMDVLLPDDLLPLLRN